MKRILLIFLITNLSACGIDKESAPPLSSVTDNSGELDTTFNLNGYLSLDGSAGGSSNDEVNAIALDSSGRIVGVGSSVNGSGNLDIVVWRLSTNGTLDATFSGDGVFTHDSAAGGSSTDVAYGLAIDSSDSIYVTGTSLNGSGDYDMVVWKLDSSGSLDTSFNGTGIFIDDNAAGGGQHDQGTAIHIDAAGDLFITGFSDQTATNRDMAIWKVQSDGSLDTSFSGDGIFTHDSAAGGEDDNGNDLLTDLSGNLYVVGRSDSAANLDDMAIWKLTSSGILDTSFNGTGYFTQNGAAGGSGFDVATAMAIDSGGDLYVTGYSRNSSGNNDMVIWKFKPNGTLDTTFDSDGVVISDVSTIVGGATNDSGESILIDSEGKIVVAGGGNQDLCVWRYEPDGTLDTTFNTDGFFSHDSAAGGFSDDSATSITEDSSNRLIIGGFSENNSSDFDATFWRLK